MVIISWVFSSMVDNQFKQKLLYYLMWFWVCTEDIEDNCITKEDRNGYLISDKVDFRGKKFTRDKRDITQWQNVNLPKRCNNPKCVFTKQQSYRKCEAKTGAAERRNEQIYKYAWILQHS